MDEMKIKCFLYAAKYMSFTEAASRMYITQPAFSRNIAALEKELGFPLFIRDNKQKACRLSPEGVVMNQGLIRLSREFSLLHNRAKSIHRGEEGKMSIGFLNGYMMDERISKVLGYFSDVHPNLEIELRSCRYEELISGLTSDQLDLSVTLEIEVKNLPGIRYETLYSTRSCLVIPSNYKETEGHQYSIRDFMDKTFILTKDSPAISSLLQEVLSEWQISPNFIEAPDQNTQLLWIEAGRGIAGNGDKHLILSSPSLKHVYLKEFHDLNYAAAWSKDNYNPALALFLSYYFDYELIS